MLTRTNIFVTTKDLVRVVGTLVLPDDTPQACALLLHMMPADRKSFSAFQEALGHCNVTSLAIDLRGHGESIQQDARILDYKKFTDLEHQQSILDVDAAFNYLVSFTRLPLEKTVLIGASIGANLALRFHAEHPAIALSIALSPGLSYRGIAINDVCSAITFPSKVVLATSREDVYSYETVHALAPSQTDAIIPKIVEGSEHGTNLFLDPDFLRELIDQVRLVANQG